MQLRQNFCLTLPALGRAELSEQHRQLQVVLPGEDLLRLITDPPTHPSRADIPFLLFILMNSTPKSLLRDKNSDNLLTASRRVAAPLKRDLHVVGHAFLQFRASPNCILLHISMN